MLRSRSRLLLTIGSLAVLLAGPVAALCAQDEAAQIAAIRQRAAAYVEALNAGDRDVLAASWTPNGRYVNAEGRSTVAQELIAALFTDDQAPAERRARRIVDEQIGLVAPGVALQEGTTQFVDGPSHAGLHRFSAIWVLRDGQWLLNHLHESIAPSPPHNSRLDQLNWLLGEFSGQADDGTNVVVVAAISPDGNFILRDFLVTLPDQSVHSVHQRIGWDPHASHYKSWVFDSDGSYGEGIWHQHGLNWTVINQGVATSGELKSGVNVYTHIHSEGFVVESAANLLGDEARPSVKLRLVREGVEQ